jgi:hypothetical protein
VRQYDDARTVTNFGVGEESSLADRDAAILRAVRQRCRDHRRTGGGLYRPVGTHQPGAGGAEVDRTCLAERRLERHGVGVREDVEGRAWNRLTVDDVLRSRHEADRLHAPIALDPGPELLLDTVGQRQDRHHGTDADDHAERGKQRSEWVQAERADPDVKRRCEWKWHAAGAKVRGGRHDVRIVAAA